MRGRLRWILRAVLLITPGLAFGAEARPGEFVVRDVAVFFLDAFGNQLNDKDAFESTLPPASSPGRPLAQEDGDRPSPLGVISFSGKGPSEIDVLLEPLAGRGLSAWPRADLKRKRILWEDLQLTTEAPGTAVRAGREWLAPLRKADYLHATLNQNSERFLLYDTEIAYRPVIQVARVKAKGGEEGPEPQGGQESGAGVKDEFTLENSGGYPVHDVIMVQPVRSGGGWRVTYLDALPGVPNRKAKPAKRPAVRNRAGEVAEATDPESVFVRPLTNKDLPPEPEPAPDPKTAKPEPPAPDRKLDTDQAKWTGYLSETAFETQIETERAARRIPAVIEGRRNGTVVTYRAKFVDQPEGSEIRVHYNLPEPEYQSRQEEYDRIGLSRISLQSFTDPTSQLRYQAIWLAYADEKRVETRVTTFSGTMAVPGLPPRLGESLKVLGLDSESLAHVERMLGQLAFDPLHGTVIYRLDREEFDSLLPIELTPEPERLVRVGLVVMVNGDPDFPEFVRGILEGLAALKWQEREAAMERLRGLGPAARPELQAALKHKDPEVAWRAEMLLEELKKP